MLGCERTNVCNRNAAAATCPARRREGTDDAHRTNHPRHRSRPGQHGLGHRRAVRSAPRVHGVRLRVHSEGPAAGPAPAEDPRADGRGDRAVRTGVRGHRDGVVRRERAERVRHGAGTRRGARGLRRARSRGARVLAQPDQAGGGGHGFGREGPGAVHGAPAAGARGRPAARPRRRRAGGRHLLHEGFARRTGAACAAYDVPDRGILACGASAGKDRL